MSVFDEIRTYISIEKDAPTPLLFEDDEPFRVKPDSFGNTQYIFNVNGSEMISIGSKPLMRALKPFTPLGGKTLVIERTGLGYETHYTVVAVFPDE